MVTKVQQLNRHLLAKSNNLSLQIKALQKTPNRNQEKTNSIMVTKVRQLNRHLLAKSKKEKLANNKTTNRSHIMVLECCQPSERQRCQYQERIIFPKVAHLSCYLIIKYKVAFYLFLYLSINKNRLFINKS